MEGPARCGCAMCSAMTPLLLALLLSRPALWLSSFCPLCHSFFAFSISLISCYLLPLLLPHFHSSSDQSFSSAMFSLRHISSVFSFTTSCSLFFLGFFCPAPCQEKLEFSLLFLVTQFCSVHFFSSPFLSLLMNVFVILTSSSFSAVFLYLLLHPHNVPSSSSPSPLSGIAFSAFLLLCHSVQTFLRLWARQEKNRQHYLRTSPQPNGFLIWVCGGGWETFLKMRNIQMRLNNAGAFQMLSVFCRILGAFVVAELLSAYCSHNHNLICFAWCMLLSLTSCIHCSWYDVCYCGLIHVVSLLKCWALMGIRQGLIHRWSIWKSLKLKWLNFIYKWNSW